MNHNNHFCSEPGKFTPLVGVCVVGFRLSLIICLLSVQHQTHCQTLQTPATLAGEGGYNIYDVLKEVRQMQFQVFLLGTSRTPNNLSPVAMLNQDMLFFVGKCLRVENQRSGP